MKYLFLPAFLILLSCSAPHRIETPVVPTAHQSQSAEQCKVQPELEWCHEHH